MKERSIAALRLCLTLRAFDRFEVWSLIRLSRSINGEQKRQIERKTGGIDFPSFANALEDGLAHSECWHTLDILSDLGDRTLPDIEVLARFRADRRLYRHMQEIIQLIGGNIAPLNDKYGPVRVNDVLHFLGQHHFLTAACGLALPLHIVRSLNALGPADRTEEILRDICSLNAAVMRGAL